ncbi:MAG TPA: GspH/FimT family pseudopilin [Longimicrobiaceae bacterium]|nr:GspH/FimT family pseudopilin [Longimicrobiaceae bacterium]
MPVTLPSRGSSGFTLFELMAVVLILTIAAALAFPRFDALTARTRSRGALDRVAADLYYARILAVREGQRVVLRFTPIADGSGCHSPVYTLVVLSTPEREAKRTELELGPAACVQFGSTDSVVFNSRGLPAALNNRRIYVRSGPATDSLVLSRLGRVWRSY